MFTVTSKRLFWWPVTVKIPHSEKAGEQQDHTFEMQFEAMPLDRAAAIDAARNTLPEAERAKRSFDFLNEIAKGWRDVVGQDGEAVAFSTEAFEAQLNFAWFRDGVLEAYREAVTGQAARLGN
ncbi:hypothetical protein [Methylobacterium sp. WL6]|uniref:hypothetical protein n=1 Tax=Methylobacterium sp. WL6 TaxID=2603901 RepID=UPI0011C8C93F|nr:hypothetical protein [Methylobacterium sp. WL6]TXN60898.1 hypothetical protein FV230_25065 [Methylobacterium sp. WL6]